MSDLVFFWNFSFIILKSYENDIRCISSLYILHFVMRK